MSHRRHRALVPTVLEHGLALAVAQLIAIVSLLNAQPPSERPTTSEGRVAALFASNCTHCHSGPDPYQGMGLTADRFYSNTVGRRSTQNPTRMLVSPGNPDSSYLVMKVRGAHGIVGRRMPIAAAPLSDDEVGVIVEWIRSLRTVDEARIASEPRSGRGVARPFAGWKLGNIPTTRMLGDGNTLFLIEHRFVPDLASGIEDFFGLDGGANIMLSLGYAPIDELMFTIARSPVGDDVELAAKYRLFAQTDEGMPFALALMAAGSVETAKREDSSDAGTWRFAAQAPMSYALNSDIGLALVPGILLNPSLTIEGESPLIAVGVGGKWTFYRFYSLFGEWAPIVTGYSPTTAFGLTNRYDSWTAGIDIALGGHDFQVFVTNSIGTTTNQYMRGGDLDIAKGDLRLGFNIYRAF